MPQDMPEINKQSYEALLRNVLSRARIHNPEWTNLSESDPGVTVLELFAYMTEQLIARGNQIADRNRRKFLSLLGVPLQPAVCARGFVTFQNERRPTQSIVIPPDIEVRAGQIPFRLISGLEALPIDALVCYKRAVDGSGQSAPTADFAKLYGLPPEAAETRYYQTTVLEAPKDIRYLPLFDMGSDAIDRSLWIALLARPKEDPEEVRAEIASATLNIGILPAPPASRSLPPRHGSVSPSKVPLIFEAATDQFHADTGAPVYRLLPATMTVDVLQEPGIVSVRLPDKAGLRLWDLPDPRLAGTGDLPPLISDPKLSKQVVSWIRIRFPAAEGGLYARFNWVEINAAIVIQKVHVHGELLGRGTGEPNQTYSLVQKPVVPGTVHLTVGGTPWQEIDDILAAGPEVPLRDSGSRPGFQTPARPTNLFQVDPGSGEVRFGDGARGARPPMGAEIRAGYAYGGGRAGNVEIGQIKKALSLPPVVKVNNPLPTWGGVDAQTIENAERQLSSYLKHRDRLVTTDDFYEIIQHTPGVEMGRVEVLPLFNPDLPHGGPSPGCVTIMVVPRPGESDIGPPQPDRRFLDMVCTEVDTRRLITTEVHVRGPIYKPFRIAVGIEVETGRAFPPVREAVKNALQKFLSPVTGGHSQKGWPLTKTIRAKELLGAVDRVEGVAYVIDITLQDESGAKLEELLLSGLELPWPTLIDTQQGNPVPSNLRVSPSAVVRRIIPVPVTPVE